MPVGRIPALSGTARINGALSRLKDAEKPNRVIKVYRRRDRRDAEDQENRKGFSPESGTRGFRKGAVLPKGARKVGNAGGANIAPVSDTSIEDENKPGDVDSAVIEVNQEQQDNPGNFRIYAGGGEKKGRSPHEALILERCIKIAKAASQVKGRTNLTN